MHWALRWVIGWFGLLWALSDARKPPPPRLAPRAAPTDWSGPYMSTFRITSWPFVAEPSAPPIPKGLDVDRLSVLLKQGEVPRAENEATPPTLVDEPDCSRDRAPLDVLMKPCDLSARTARQLVPGLYEVRVPDEWPYAVIRCGRIVPAFRNGRAYGFKLFGVRDGYLQFGLRNGDVLLQMNGIPLASPEDALGAYAALREAKRIELDLERDGRLLKRTYVLDRPLASADLSTR